jgi:hypothetical protein
MHNDQGSDGAVNAPIPETQVAVEEASIFGAYIEPFVSNYVARLSPRAGVVFREASRRVVDAAFARDPYACFERWGDPPDVDPLMPGVLALWHVCGQALVATMPRMKPVVAAMETRLAAMPRVAIPRVVAQERLRPIEQAWFEGELPAPMMAERARAYDVVLDAFSAEDPLDVLRQYGRGDAEPFFRAFVDIVESRRTDELDVIVLALLARVAELDVVRRRGVSTHPEQTGGDAQT